MGERILITSALPYANGPIHIGHIAGAYLPADIYFKYQKLKGREVIHICGTDENGVQITIKAEEEGTTPKRVADKYHKIIKDAFSKFGIEFTNFSRTSKKIHHDFSQKFFLKLHENGYLEKKEVEQLYCENCDRFLPDRYVTGKCPYCDADARGDQCESCGRWLEPTMLKEPKCALCGGTPVIRKTFHWFFRLDLLKDKLAQWLNTKKHWKPNVIEFAKNWIKELRPRPITRDLHWGVPVPLPEAQGKVLYVWFDAPLGYISATIEWNEKEWEKWWKDENTKLVQFMGKDNIVFHTIVWPAMLMAHGDFILPAEIPANEFMNLEGQKLSTSRNWAIWLHDYLDGFPPDPLRYTLILNMPEKGDANFSWEDFNLKNNELNDILGNFVHRTLQFIKRYLNNKIPEKGKIIAEDNEIIEKMKEYSKRAGDYIDKFEFRQAMRHTMDFVRECNRYFEHGKPWEKTERTPTVIYTCTKIIANLGTFLHPFLPFTAEKIRNYLNVQQVKWDEIGEIEPHTGMELGEVEPLFQKYKRERIEIEKRKLGKKFITIDEFKKIELRIGKVEEAERLTKKLLKLKVRVGKELRQIVAGIGKEYEPEQLIGKEIIIVANLQPKVIYGEVSEGMMLCAGEKHPVILTPEKEVTPGAKVL